MASSCQAKSCLVFSRLPGCLASEGIWGFQDVCSRGFLTWFPSIPHTSLQATLTIRDPPWAWHLALPLPTEPISWCSFLKSWILETHRHSVPKAVVPSDQAEAWHYCISVPPRTGFSVYHTEGETAGFPKRALASSGNLGKIGLFRKAAEPPCLDGCGEVLGVGGHFVLCVKDGEVFVLMT